MADFKSLKILIRCDATSEIGTGHLMRSLTLAKRFVEDEVAFATRELEGNLEALIEEHGYKRHSLKNNKAKTLIQCLKKEKTDLLIIDHYDLDAAFERELKEALPRLKIMALDDTYQKHN
jgi:spore coat polysaccharide biosynthesis predicted glycosyltransferase SpsG